MSDDVPHRYKDESELDGDELLATVQARAADEEPPKFESKAYTEHKAAALREAGLSAEADELEAEANEGEGVPVEEMSTAQHYDRIRGGKY